MITQIQIATLNAQHTLIRYTYYGCDCELRLDNQILDQEEAVKFLSKLTEYEHEENQTIGDEFYGTTDTGNFYTDNYER